MLIYMNDKNYGVYLEEDGDDLWITVTNGYIQWQRLRYCPGSKTATTQQCQHHTKVYWH